MHEYFIYSIFTIITPSSSFHIPHCLKFMISSLMIFTYMCTYMCVTMCIYEYAFSVAHMCIYLWLTAWAQVTYGSLLSAAISHL